MSPQHVSQSTENNARGILLLIDIWGNRVVNKKHLKRGLNRLQSVQTWQLIILLILSGFVSATFLRLNNIGMVERREAVISADKVGNEAITQARLYDLQRYVTTHMNTDMGKGVGLDSSYKRALQAADTAASANTNPNGNIFKKAQQVCAPRFSSWSEGYVQCTYNELSKYPGSDSLINQVKVSPNVYNHAFVSPLWSPDFAGWSLLICVVILIMIISRFISVVILRLLLRRRYGSI